MADKTLYAMPEDVFNKYQEATRVAFEAAIAAWIATARSLGVEDKPSLFIRFVEYRVALILVRLTKASNDELVDEFRSFVEEIRGGGPKVVSTDDWTLQ